jgi:hypothetical protein
VGCMVVLAEEADAGKVVVPPEGRTRPSQLKERP